MGFEVRYRNNFRAHKGGMIYVWWDCPRIGGLWNSIFSIIRKVTGLTVVKSPHIALLNFPVAPASKSMQRLIFFILTGAKLTIVEA